MGHHCPHSIVEPRRVSDIVIEIYCKRCGEVVGTSIDTSKDHESFITGEVRELTEEEREALT